MTSNPALALLSTIPRAASKEEMGHQEAPAIRGDRTVRTWERTRELQTVGSQQSASAIKSADYKELVS